MEVPLSSILMICQEILLESEKATLEESESEQSVEDVTEDFCKLKIDDETSCHQTVQVHHPLIVLMNQHLYPPMSHAKN